MNIAGFYLVYALLWVVTFLPLRVLYLFSDLLFYIIFHLIGYRKNVIYENLRFAFPEKEKKEIDEIAKKFYIHFCDNLIESAKILHISKAELNRRFRFRNIELLNDLFDENKSVVLVSGHYGNWEWMIDAQSKTKHKFMAIYKPLVDENFDRMIKNLRMKYANGAEMISMNNIYKSILTENRAGQKIITWFLADQTPPQNYPFWIDFMNRETPFYSGPAKVSKKFNCPVVFMQINKINRGNYETTFSMLVEDPKIFSEKEIIEKYVRKIEEGIKQRPQYWLWSHRRWKHNQENIDNNKH